jgi:hypothetical protein
MINSTSNASKASKTSIAYPTLASKISVNLIHVLKALDSSQCPSD